MKKHTIWIGSVSKIASQKFCRIIVLKLVIFVDITKRNRCESHHFYTQPMVNTLALKSRKTGPL